MMAALTWVKGLLPEEVLQILGGTDVLCKKTLLDVELQLDRMMGRGIVAGNISEDWVFAVEPGEAVCQEQLLKLSQGGEAISYCWNVNGLDTLEVATHGRLLASVSDLFSFVPFEGEEPMQGMGDIYGEEPKTLSHLVGALAQTEDEDFENELFQWIIGKTGGDLPSEWSASPQFCWSSIEKFSLRNFRGIWRAGTQ